MAKMSMIDQKLLQMQLEAMQTMRMLMVEKVFMAMNDLGPVYGTAVVAAAAAAFSVD